MAKRSFRPAVSAFLLMLTMSLLSTALSFFVSPVCADLGFGRGSFTLYYSLMVAAGAVSASVLGNYMNSHGVRGVILISALWCCAGAWGLSFSSALWMFYLAGAAIGFFGTTCVYLAANVIVQQSYHSSQASAVLGLVMAGSGIGGVIWSNLFPALIASLGWRMGYRILGLIWLSLALLSALILGRQEPTAAIGHARTPGDSSSKREALRSLRFVLVAAVMCVLTVASCISQQLPALLGGMGHGSEQVSRMVSVMTAFSAVGTVVEGLACSKLGIRKTMVIVIAMYAAGYVLMSANTLVYVALMCLAFGSGAIGTLMPIVVRTIFGGIHYAAIWSVVITCSSVASFLATPVWGMVYDLSGSYGPALVTMPVLLGASIFALTAAFRGTE